MAEEDVAIEPPKPLACGTGQGAPLVARELILVARQLRSRLDGRLRSAGSSLTAYLVMCVVAEDGPQPQRQIAERVEVSEATLTRQVDAMERAGLLTRRRPSGDRRVVTVSLTAEGRRRHATLTRAAEEVDRELAESMSAQSRDQLLTILGELGSSAPAPAS